VTDKSGLNGPWQHDAMACLNAYDLGPMSRRGGETVLVASGLDAAVIVCEETPFWPAATRDVRSPVRSRPTIELA
jgi:hypothetical protein